jgi:hypothetical protein
MDVQAARTAIKEYNISWWKLDVVEWDGGDGFKVAPLYPHDQGKNQRPAGKRDCWKRARSQRLNESQHGGHCREHATTAVFNAP